MGKINVFDKIVMKKRREKISKSKKFIHKSKSKRRVWNGIYSFLIRADARGSADNIYCMWCISPLCGPGIVNAVTKVGHAQNIYYQRRHKSKSRTEYLLPTACIILLDSYFNFTKKSNLVGNL